MFRATNTPVSGLVAETGLGANPGSLSEAEDGVTELSSLQSPATGRSPCVCVRACACVRVGGGWGLLDGSLRAGPWPFLSRPVLLGLTCGLGCTLGVVRASRPLLWSEGKSLQAPAGVPGALAVPPRAGSNSTTTGHGRSFKHRRRGELLRAQEFI